MIVTNHYCQTEAAIFHKAKESERYSGDRFFIHEVDNGLICALADGLGSGKDAKESADSVIQVIKENINAKSKEIIQLCNLALSSKRGVVLGILRLDYKKKEYDFLSIGNIGLILEEKNGSKRKRFLPQRGYLTEYFRPFKEESGKLKKGAKFFMFSDGVQDKELKAPFMKENNVKTIVNLYSILYGERRNDDTTLIALRYDGIQEQMMN